MEALVQWFSHNLSQYISPEGAVFFISMIPLLELRGGLLAASLLKIPAVTAIPLCIAGNIIPIPFILLFIRKIFKVMKKTKIFRGLIQKLEDRAMGKSDQVKKYEFWGLTLFVGIPLPGTGAWTGSLIASSMARALTGSLVPSIPSKERNASSQSSSSSWLSLIWASFCVPSPWTAPQAS